MPKLKIEVKPLVGKSNSLNIEVSDEITIAEILEVLKVDYALKMNLNKISLYLKLQGRYLDIDSKIDEEGIVDNEVFIIRESNEEEL